MKKGKVEKFLIAGLGNPGEKYKKTRHNFGFEVLDYFSSEKNKIENTDFPPEFNYEPKFEGLFSMLNFGDRKVFLIKPQTFMNLSGRSIGKALSYYKIKKSNFLLVHDDLDIEIGSLKFSKNSRSAGHHGVESVINELGSKDFSRLRLGIKNAQLIASRQVLRDKFVLEKFLPEEEAWYRAVLDKAVKAIDHFIEVGFKKDN
jgi:PTH1 family peptidyl-tRNA hydrolase